MDHSQPQLGDCHLLVCWCMKTTDIIDYQFRKNLCEYILEKYAYHVIHNPEHTNDSIVDDSNVCSFLLKWIFDYNDTNNEYDKIWVCECILENVDSKCVDEFRINVATKFFYRDIVHNEADHDKKIERLISKFPQYRHYVDDLYKNTNVLAERIKSHKDIQPMFNGSGCSIL